MVTRAVRLPSELLHSDGEVVLELSQGMLGPVILELDLLLHAYVSEVQLRRSRGPSVRLRCSVDERHVPRVHRVPEGDFAFDLARTDVEYMHGFLLRAYRDGMGEVSHIHVEARGEPGSFDLTVMLELYKPPMSAEDAKRLLDEE